ncbi:methylaspartate mutase subunit E [Desulfotomaculum copahuensis]|uniref:Glutamate mutase epsilon subunit n=1 Tax=Desulfotomaculum copahuensis TaxID=1838280 RepID=A0A1B7LE48_9FIRM|nr:methylaspartate mutase subunit E [Desulfotomaculum copahuensis]OAT81325.1 methylaspartate mutase subunit E [Desulfotomaculum copahuensis]
MELKNQKWPADEFFSRRREVLAAWPTGREVDLDEAVAYHRRAGAGRSMAALLDQARTSGRTLAQPRAGVALLLDQIELLRYLAAEGEADCLPATIDSYTRQNRYAEAQAGIEESRAAGRSMLNGFPAVNYGVAACRRVVEAVDVPVQVRHGTPDARLLAEITLAGGFTSFEGGGISYNIPYAKDVPLEKSIADWQYVDRLAGWYLEHGVTINREFFGPLTGTLVPPGISHAVGVIEALLAAEQGVKNVTLGYGQCGNLIQDVAAMLTLPRLAEDYLERCGYRGVTVTTVLHQWMGGFPADESKAFGVIAWGAATAALAGADKVIVKTPHEAVGVPGKEANAAGIKATKQVLNMLRDQFMPPTPELTEEIAVIRAETTAIVDKTLDLGDGDVALGTVRAFKAGVIDVPFAPSRFNAGRLLPARDNRGAVRLLEPANLPFDRALLDFHRERLAERGRVENREPGFQMVIDDIYAIGKGMLVGRPR